MFLNLMEFEFATKTTFYSVAHLSGSKVLSQRKHLSHLVFKHLKTSLWTGMHFLSFAVGKENSFIAIN